MTDIDVKLQKLAIENWDEFIRIIGEDSLIVAKMRLLKQEGKTYRQICLKLEVTENQARYAIRTSPLKINGESSHS